MAEKETIVGLPEPDAGSGIYKFLSMLSPTEFSVIEPRKSVTIDDMGGYSLVKPGQYEFEGFATPQIVTSGIDAFKALIEDPVEATKSGVAGAIEGFADELRKGIVAADTGVTDTFDPETQTYDRFDPLSLTVAAGAPIAYGTARSIKAMADADGVAVGMLGGKGEGFLANMKLMRRNAGVIRKTPDREQAFSGTASLQRGAPETKMRELQGYMGGGVMSHAIEHGGDLLHRMTEYGGEYSYNAKSKIKNLMASLNRGPNYISFEEEFSRNNKNNYLYDLKTSKEDGVTPKATTLEEFEGTIDEGLGEYAAFHSSLPVFNELQLAARNVAVALGRKNFDEARYHLSILNEAIDDGSFDARNLEFDPDFESKAARPDSNYTVLGMLGGKKPDLSKIPNTGIGPFAALTNRRPVSTYHGSGTDFDEFSMSAVGTGEGAQMYGHGLYLSDLEDVGQYYRDQVGQVVDVLADPGVALEERAAGFNSMGILNETADATEALIEMQPEIVEIDGVKHFFIKDTEENANENFLFTELPDAVGVDNVYSNLGQGTFRYMYPDGTSVVTRSKNADGVEYEHPETGEFGVIVEFIEPSQGKVMKVDMDIDPKTEMLDYFETLDRQDINVLQKLRYAAEYVLREQPVGSMATLKPDTSLLREVAKDLERVQEKGKLSRVDGMGVLDSFGRALGVRRDAPEVSNILRRFGLRGTKYYTAGSRGRSLEEHERTYNYVVFDDTALKITDKYREGGAVTADHGIGGFIPYMVQ